MNYKKDVEKLQGDLNKTIKLLFSLDDMGTLRTYGTQARNLTKKLNFTINEFKNKTKNWDDEYKKSVKNEKNINFSDKNIKKISKKPSKKTSKKLVKQQGGEINIIENDNKLAQKSNKILIKHTKNNINETFTDTKNANIEAIKDLLNSMDNE